MKITNKHNLPQTIVNAIERPNYSKGNAALSVTELIGPPQLVALKHKHESELESDAADMVWSLFGSAVHSILEQGADEDHILEERLYAKVNDWTISGAVDVQRYTDTGIDVLDYKVTKAYSVMHEKPEWELQLNCYAWLINQNKQSKVKSLAIVAIVRDWSAREAERVNDYPQAPVVVIPVRLWGKIEQEEYINKRVHLHQAAYVDVNVGTNPKACTSEEMWEKPTCWALMKEGRKSAVKIHWDKPPELPDDKHYVEVREGERTRCKSYCPVSQFCSQYQTYLGEE